MLNVGPGGDDATHDHEAEGEQSHRSDRPAEPQDLAVRDQDDGQVLEDGIDGNGEELQRLAACVDHANEAQRDGEPLARLVAVEGAEGYEPCRLGRGDSHDAHGGLHRQQQAVHVEVAAQNVFIGGGHQDAATAIRQDADHRIVGRASAGGGDRGAAGHVGGGGGRALWGLG